MALSRSPIAGIVLTGGIAVAAAVFGWLNWHWLEERRMLESEGVATVARIEAVTISHKACNSSARLRWTDARGEQRTGSFMTCFANRSEGEAVPIRYSESDPEVAMIAPGEGGLPDEQYRTGAIIGAVAALVMAAVAGRLSIVRRR